MPGTVLELPVAVPVTDVLPEPQVAESEQRPQQGLTVPRLVTALLVGGPVIGLALLVLFGWGGHITGWAIGLAVAFYAVTGLGVTVGYHRLFAHRGFTSNRMLKVALAVAGSLALEGSVIGWVAVHRTHHVFSDQAGDPHSPQHRGSGFGGLVRGFIWAHVGWLFSVFSTDTKRYAPDLRKDRDLVVVDRLFPILCFVSLAVPFGIGWAISGTLAGAFAVFLWAGLVRMAVLHHATWSINSVCHLWGKRPFATKDQSTNFAPLALLSLGESWHNFHHASPASARHGVLAHQVDISAVVIRLFEKVGWVTKVRWPTQASIANALVAAKANSLT